MVQERPLPKSAIFVAIDPISAKASALFDELVSMSNVRFIFLAEGIDSHANYLKNRPHGLVAQMFSGDFGWLRRAADTISNFLSAKLPSVPGTFNLEAPPPRD